MIGGLGPPPGGFGWDRSLSPTPPSPLPSAGSASEGSAPPEEDEASSSSGDVPQVTDYPFVGTVALIAVAALALTGGVWRSTPPPARAVGDRPVSTRELACSFSKSVVREAQREGATAMVVRGTEALSRSLDDGDCTAALTALKGLAAWIDLDEEDPPRLTRNMRELRQDVLSACRAQIPDGDAIDRAAPSVCRLGAASPD